ncbi:MAG: glycosyltransferase family 39 protein, partial [Fimbriimonas ginsengisoli]|nr:glycosyltransferase family 39 protein [Fimbriimonas ginsengisoli]
MLGLAITVVVCLSLVLVGLTPLADRISPIGRLGLFGLFGLGTYGLALGVEGLIGTLTGWGGHAALIAFVVVLGCNLAFPDRATSKIGPLLGPHSLLDLFRAPRLPRGMEWAFAIPIGLALLFALVGVLAPSTAIDWDSLAYHLAVPKLWLESGFRPAAVPFIHHSSFPAGFDSLFILGLSWGGETGAKAFVWMSLVFGVLAVMGVARDLYGRKAAWWAGLAFATVPLVIWESGTAYIDVPHGLCAGLGILFAARLAAEPTRRDWLWMSGLCLGFAASSKYTGL